MTILKDMNKVIILFRILQPLAGILCSCDDQWDAVASNCTALLQHWSIVRVTVIRVMPILQCLDSPCHFGIPYTS